MPTDAELQEILLQHAAWVKDNSFPISMTQRQACYDNRRANLCDASLTGADLNHAESDGAELMKAHLETM